MSLLSDMPVLGVCGASGSGKTTLIESVLPELLGRGLRVAVVKHALNGVELDREGKDSDRFFRAGADVVMRGGGEEAWRFHGEGGDLASAVLRIAQRYDLVLVEGHKETPTRKLWLTGPEGGGVPEGVEGVMRVLEWEPGRRGAMLAAVDGVLEEALRAAPVFACVPAACAGSDEDLMNCVKVLEPFVREVVVTGGAEAAAGGGRLLHSPDAACIGGPFADIVTAMRWAGGASWLVVVGDAASVTPEAVSDALAERRPGVWVLGGRRGRGMEEAPLAYFDRRARPVVEEMTAVGETDLPTLSPQEQVLTISGAIDRLFAGQ